MIRRLKTLRSNHAILSWPCSSVWIYRVSETSVSYRHVIGFLNAFFAFCMKMFRPYDLLLGKNFVQRALSSIDWWVCFSG